MNAANNIESLITETLSTIGMTDDGSQPVSISYVKVAAFKAEHPFHSATVAAMMGAVAALLPATYAMAKVVCL